MDLIVAISIPFTGRLDHTQRNLASILSILYSVSKKIDQNFLYAEFVTVNIQILNFPNINAKFLILFQSLFPDNNIGFSDNI